MDLQQTLLDSAVRKCGSLDVARRYVKSPEESAHTRGAAIDVGPMNAVDWMIRYGVEYGFCQTYSNELWHYELTAVAGQCQAPLPDASGS